MVNTIDLPNAIALIGGIFTYETDQILIDYYNNLFIEDNRKNLDKIEDIISKINLRGLTQIRIFDILWWSCLKADRLKREYNINWTSIKMIGIKSK
jgi:hypothetical protein